MSAAGPTSRLPSSSRTEKSRSRSSAISVGKRSPSSTRASWKRTPSKGRRSSRGTDRSANVIGKPSGKRTRKTNNLTDGHSSNHPSEFDHASEFFSSQLPGHAFYIWGGYYIANYPPVL